MENIITDNINFEVIKRPLQTLLNNQFVTVDNKYCNIKINTDGIEEYITTVGQHYTIVDHREVINSLYNVITKKYSNITYKHTLQGGKIISQFDLNDEIQMGLNEKEKFIPSIYAVNSYDGTAQFAIGIGIIRLICSNGQFLVDNNTIMIKQKHIMNLQFNHIIDQCPKAINNYQSLYINFQDKAVNSNPLNLDNLEDKKSKFPKKIVKQVIESKPVNAWEQYNKFTNIITHAEIQPNSKIVYNNLMAEFFQSQLLQIK